MDQDLLWVDQGPVRVEGRGRGTYIAYHAIDLDLDLENTQVQVIIVKEIVDINHLQDRGNLDIIPGISPDREIEKSIKDQEAGTEKEVREDAGHICRNFMGPNRWRYVHKLYLAVISII